MTPEQERWSEAAAVLRMYGNFAPKHVAERVASLAIVGEPAGVDRWMEIARRLDQMLTGDLQ